MANLFQNNTYQHQFLAELALEVIACNFISRKFSLDDSLLNSSKDFIK